MPVTRSTSKANAGPAAEKSIRKSSIKKSSTITPRKKRGSNQHHEGFGEGSQSLTNAVAELEEKVSLLEQDNARLRCKNNQLKAANLASGMVVVDAMKLAENIECEICTSSLKDPWILKECGHSFCLSCLDTWFSRTLAKHIEVHPHYRIVHNLDRHLLPQPSYRCPKCRESVTERPSEDFTLKALVDILSEAMGESRAPIQRSAWETFFGPK
ncbi:hypothetical protein C8J56DRAFT_371488 [Mycena floridula]|nr:hypothetical protein C8J56DRAFT_371488 [Mycena floridula]